MLTKEQLAAIKPGDKITAEFEVIVTYLQKNEPFITVRDGGNNLYLYINPESVIKHTPKPREITVGTRFFLCSDKIRIGQVVAKFENQNMCKFNFPETFSVWSDGGICKSLTNNGYPE